MIFTEEQISNMGISEWLDYSFRHFDDHLVLIEKGRISRGDSIQRDRINSLSEEIRKINEELTLSGKPLPHAFDRTSEEGEKLHRYTKALDGALQSRKDGKQRLEGVKSGRYALKMADELFKDRSLQDKVTGYALFVEKYSGVELDRLHDGFVYAVNRRLDRERRKLDEKRWSEYQDKVRVAA